MSERNPGREKFVHEDGKRAERYDPSEGREIRPFGQPGKSCI